MASSSIARLLIASLITLGLVLVLGIALYNINSTPEPYLPAGELRIAVDASYPPFAVATADDLFGIDIDIGREIARRLDVPVRFVNMGFDGLYDSVQANQTDIIVSALLVNPARDGDVLYTKLYFDAGLVLVSTSGLQQMEDVSGLRVAYEYGSAGDSELRRWERLVEQPFESLPYELPDYALEAVQLGDADVALVDAVSARLYLREHPEWEAALHYVTSQPYAIAVGTDRYTLFLHVNDVLEAMMEDGTLEEILSRYL